VRWGVVLCTCNNTLPVDRKALRAGLGLPVAPPAFARLQGDELQQVGRLVARERYDRVLVACCGPRELFAEAMAAAGAEDTPVDVVSLREPCYWSHPDAAGGSVKAVRLLRAAMRAAEARPRGIEHPLRVGPRVLVATDSPRGLDLARRLQDVARPTLLLDEASSGFDPLALHPLPFAATWGRLARIQGRLGDFQLVVEQRQPIDLATCIACMKCVPVCHTQAISRGLRLREDLCDRCGDCVRVCDKVGAIRIPRQERRIVHTDQVVVITRSGPAPGPTRTGHHLLVAPTAPEVDAAAWRVTGLIGEFRKPEHVRYEPATCAGGGAGKEACGLCIPACPYEAIARQGLRVAVDQMACEGCGACVGVCPTSSLRFTDPSDVDLFRRLAALLEPVPGAAADRPVVAFHCGEKGREALAAAGRERLPYPASVLPVAVPCLRYAEADILGALRLGAAGVALLGCETCPHGPRPALETRVATCRAILEAFGVQGARIRLVATDGSPAPALAELEALAAAVDRPPLAWAGPPPATEHRAVVANAIAALCDATGRDPGRLAGDPAAPFGYPAVDAPGCTLCRSCVNVCPTHAFRLVEATHALELKHVDCVACGLCAAVCPERVITLTRELPLARASLDWAVVVQDEMIGCAKCGKPYINRRALDAVEAKVRSLAALADVFAGSRRDLLRLCPDCRAVVAVAEMQEGWEP
jgi:heterodisulfide reductase subunit A-like polyferredoxin/coenzyme F420-reducing hydrogenase delta subunit